VAGQVVKGFGLESIAGVRAADNGAPAQQAWARRKFYCPEGLRLSM
jgi:hypothetical protein